MIGNEGWDCFFFINFNRWLGWIEKEGKEEFFIYRGLWDKKR